MSGITETVPANIVATTDSPFGAFGGFGSGEENNNRVEKRGGFPTGALPDDIADFVREVSRVTLVPDSLVAMNVLGLLSASIGGGLLVESGPGRLTPANLFLLGIARSGTGKGRTFGVVAKAFQEAEAEAVHEWEEQELPRLRAELRVVEKEMKRIEGRGAKGAGSSNGIQSLDALTELEKRRTNLLKKVEREPGFSVADVTREKLVSALASQPGEALASLSPEGRGVIDVILGRYSNGNSSDEDVYLSAYSREPIRTSRVGRGTVSLQNPCLAVLWLIQPDVAAKLFGNAAMTDSGLLPRFLICDTKAEAEDEPEHHDPLSSEVVDRWKILIRELLLSFRRLGDEPLIVRPTGEAGELIRQFTNEGRKRTRTGGDLRHISAYPLRWGENAWRVALVLHAAIHGKEAGEQDLDENTAQQAVEIVRWFAGEQLDLLREARVDRLEERREQLVSILSENGGEQTLRLLGKTHRFPRAEVERLAQQFPDTLRIEERKTKGRPSLVALLSSDG